MATTDSQFVRHCQVGAQAAVEAALAGGQAVNILNKTTKATGKNTNWQFPLLQLKLNNTQITMQSADILFTPVSSSYSLKGLFMFQSFLIFELQVNCQDGDGNTGLMLAICYKKKSLVDMLLARSRRL